MVFNLIIVNYVLTYCALAFAVKVMTANQHTRFCISFFSNIFYYFSRKGFVSQMFKCHTTH